MLLSSAKQKLAVIDNEINNIGAGQSAFDKIRLTLKNDLLCWDKAHCKPPMILNFSSRAPASIVGRLVEGNSQAKHVL
jgi:hypothetical protein